MVSNILGKNNAPRDQTCNLLEYYRVLALLDSDDVLLVALGARRTHCILKPALLVLDIRNRALYGRAVHMHVKDAQEDADPRFRSAGDLNRSDVGNMAVARGNDRPGVRRNFTLRVTKEPQEKGSEQHWRNRPPGRSQPGKQPGKRQHCYRVVVAVPDHRIRRLYRACRCGAGMARRPNPPPTNLPLRRKV